MRYLEHLHRQAHRDAHQYPRRLYNLLAGVSSLILYSYTLERPIKPLPSHH
jgi:hypothetical protein